MNEPKGVDDEYWFEGSYEPFNFNDDEDVPQGLKDIETQSTLTESSTALPLEAIISQKSLDLILDDISSNLECVVNPSKDTIYKAFLGHKFLEIYKRFSDKMELLDSALETSDGNIIINVILYLKSTLYTSIFYQQLSKRKLAVKHYANYLIMTNQFQELSDFYMATGNATNLKQVFYFIGKETKNRTSIFKKLEQFSLENLQTKNSDEILEIRDNLNFLEWQMGRNLTADNVIEQLAKLCSTEWQNNKKFNVIREFKNLLKIDEMAYEWTVVNVLASMQCWKDIIDLFVKPNWFNKKNILKTTLSQEIVVYGISKHKPPKDILEQFLNYLPDSEKSVNLALKLYCHKFVIQHYINQKDRLSLISYKARLAPHEDEYFLIENALQIRNGEIDVILHGVALKYYYTPKVTESFNPDGEVCYGEDKRIVQKIN